jgi:hypothetical protein
LSGQLRTYPNLIMLNAQCNLIGSSTIVNLRHHDHDRTNKRPNTADKSVICLFPEPKKIPKKINDWSTNNVHAGSLPDADLPQVLNQRYSRKFLEMIAAKPCGYKNISAMKNYRHTDIIHFLKTYINYSGIPSFHHALNSVRAALVETRSNLHNAFRNCLKPAAHYRLHFILFLEYVSFRYSSVIYLLSRTTMRRVKFLYEKPPTTVTV